MNNVDTICAPATPAGAGAISIIRLSGPDSLKITDSVVVFRKGSAADAHGYTMKYGTVEGIDDVIVSIFRAPHSYTGEDSCEISCHASTYIVSRLLDMLVSAGCRLAEPGEFTRRAFTNGKMDLAQAEAVADLIASGSQAQHRVAMNQLRGGYSAELGKIREQLLELSALLELELDFSEEDVEFADRSRLVELAKLAYGRCKELAESFRLGNAIRNGIPVAIVGAPNSGKSTLLNALLREDRAIVSNIPGTTRDTVEECCNIGGVQFRFIDTAGIRADADDSVERMGISRSFQKLEEAEIVLLVVDELNSYAGSPFEQVEQIAERMDSSWQKLVVLVNKMDLLAPDFALDVGSDSASGSASASGSGSGSASASASASDSDSDSDSDCASDIAPEFPLNKNVIKNNSIVLYLDSKGFKYKTLKISAKTGENVDELAKCLVSFSESLPEDGILVTNARHAEALGKAANALGEVIGGISTLPTDLVAEDLREALRALGSITGEILSDEILGVVFERFCIGK